MGPSTHYVAIAGAYCRGALGLAADTSDEVACVRGTAAGLKLHRFKRTMDLARVRPVLGAVRGFAVTSMVDLGSGRGAFVWPLLDALPWMTLACVDLLPHRAKLFADLGRGGMPLVSGVRADATALPFADGAVDAVTALEVLEHIPGEGPARAIGEIMRVARTCAVATVPSKADDNPEHVQLFTGARLEAMFRAAGAKKTAIEYVANHIVCVASR